MGIKLRIALVALLGNLFNARMYRPFNTDNIKTGIKNTTKYVLTALVSPCSIMLAKVKITNRESKNPIRTTVLFFMSNQNE